MNPAGDLLRGDDVAQAVNTVNTGYLSLVEMKLRVVVPTEGRMSTLDKRRGLLPLCVGLLLYAVSAPAQTLSARLLDRFQRIVYAAFPEFRGGRMVATFTSKNSFDRDWQVEHPGLRLMVHPPGKYDRDGNELVGPESVRLTGYYIVGPDKNEVVSFHGAHVNESPIAELMQDTNRYPEWQLGDLDQALKARGATVSVLTPAIFLEHFAVERFVPVVGRIRNARATFSWRPRVADMSVQDRVLPRWIVTFEGDDGSGSKCYFLTAEPIDGRLVYFAQRNCE